MFDVVNKRARLIILLVFMTFLFVGNSWYLNSNFRTISEQQDRVTHTEEVVGELESTISYAKDAETGIRGYLLTYREEYLEPYNSGTLGAAVSLEHLKTLTNSNPVEAEAVKVISEILTKRFEILANMLREFRLRKGVFQREAPGFAEGKSSMDKLRAQVEKLRSSEKAILSARAEAAERSKYIFFWTLVFTTALSVIVISLGFAQIDKTQRKSDIETQKKAEEALEKAAMAELSQNLADEASNESAAKSIIQYLCLTLGALGGRIFIMDDNKQLRPLSALDGESESVFSSGQSTLLNAVFTEKGLSQIDNVPKDFWRVSTGMGSSLPSVLTFMPVFFQGRKIALIELGTFQPLSDPQKHLFMQLAETIGVGMNAAQSRTTLQNLLEKTQQQSEELQAQQEELRVSNEELEQQTRALESQQQALHIKNIELEGTQAQLESKALDLERSSQYKSEFLANMSHELRTPLNGILILSTLLNENKEKTLTDQQRQFARTIHSAGNDLLMLISDILDLSKIEARKLTLRPEEFSIESLLASKRRTFEPQTTAKKLKFETILPQELRNLTIFTDRQRLEQILRNFLSNAIKFTENGSVSVRAELDESRHRIRLIVADTGIGIPSNKQSAIFEAFEQADTSVSRKYGGTGLGLTISRELASLLQGQITVESVEGQGSQFTVEIPLRLDLEVSADRITNFNEVTKRALPAAASPQQVAKKMNEPSDRVTASAKLALAHLDQNKKTILVVEDDESFRSSVADAVRSYDFACVEAADGEVALAILNQLTPDAVLLDIKLPGISGLGILEIIKQMPRLRHVPVHMISALEYQQNALRLGALGYLTKPVTIEKVRSAIDRIEKLITTPLRRVLLIEDDQKQSLAVSELISGQDIEVIAVNTGKGALEELNRRSVDCIILDLTLPDVSGIDFLSELRSLEISLPPIVIYTGKDLSDEEERYLSNYSESIIIKGARSPERLLDEVNLFLHRVESLLPPEKREMLSNLRTQVKSFEGKTVLVVDDDIRNVFALTSALETRGFIVRMAKDGIEAIEAIEKYPDIDLVLMDIMMPRMNGFEAMAAIRKNANTRIKNLPVIALTAKAMKEDQEKCMEMGANDYLPKPVNLENLTTIMKVWLPAKEFRS